MKIPGLGWIKSKASRVGATLAGRKVVAMLTPLRNFVAHYGQTVGAVMTAICVWAWERDCGTFMGFDFLAFLQAHVSSGIICDGVQHFLLVVAAFLAGAGISEPDQWIKNMRGKK